MSENYNSKPSNDSKTPKGINLQYGPNTHEINAIIEVVKGLSEEEVERLVVLFDEMTVTTGKVDAYIEVRSVTYDLSDPVYDQFDKAMPESENPELWRARGVPWSAILAHLASPYIGETFTTQMRDLLLAPWEAFMEGRRLYEGRVMFGHRVIARKITNASGDEVYEVLETGQHVYPEAFKQVREITANRNGEGK